MVVARGVVGDVAAALIKVPVGHQVGLASILVIFMSCYAVSDALLMRYLLQALVRGTPFTAKPGAELDQHVLLVVWARGCAAGLALDVHAVGAGGGRLD